MASDFELLLVYSKRMVRLPKLSTYWHFLFQVFKIDRHAQSGLTIFGVASRSLELVGLVARVDPDPAGAQIGRWAVGRSMNAWRACHTRPLAVSWLGRTDADYPDGVMSVSLSAVSGLKTHVNEPGT